MSVFHESKPQMAFLKMAVYGEAGSGKTFTASLIAVGLHKLIKSDKPVFFFDTETGSDFVRDAIETATGKRLMVAKTRAFADLRDGLKEIPDGAIVIIDSVTHYWTELVEAYKKKHNMTRVPLQGWGEIKPMWSEFTTPYVGSKLHIILCGRSADVWGEEIDETGAKELKKVGTKMRTEGQLAYEPSLLVEMELYQEMARIGAPLQHRAFVKKDRFNIMNGVQIVNPGFEDFLPHIEKLNLGGEHVALETGGASAALFADNNLGEKRYIRREILTEKIGNGIKLLIPGKRDDDVKARLELMQSTFNTNSWTEIEKLVPLDRLELGLAVIEDRIRMAVDELAAADAIKDKAEVAEAKAKGNTKPRKEKTNGAMA
jgi:hypothetical protein